MEAVIPAPPFGADVAFAWALLLLNRLAASSYFWISGHTGMGCPSLST